MAFSASSRSPALTNDAAPRGIGSLGADSRAAVGARRASTPASPDERRHARARVGPGPSRVEPVVAVAAAAAEGLPSPTMRTSSSSSSSSAWRATRARALAPQSCFAALDGPAAGGGAGGGRGRVARRGGGCPAFGRHRGRGRGRGRFARGMGGLRCAAIALVGFDAGRGGGRGLGDSSSRVGEPLLALADERVEHRRVRGASARRARLEHVSELHQEGHGARPIARVLSFRLRRGCAGGGSGGEGRARSRWKTWREIRTQLCVGGGARFLSDGARGTHRRVRKLAHPLECRRRVAHRGRATGQPLSPSRRLRRASRSAPRAGARPPGAHDGETSKSRARARAWSVIQRKCLVYEPFERQT